MVTESKQRTNDPVSVSRTYTAKFEGQSLSAVLEAIDGYVENELKDEPEEDFPEVAIKIDSVTADEWKATVVISFTTDS